MVNTSHQNSQKKTPGYPERHNVVIRLPLRQRYNDKSSKRRGVPWKCRDDGLCPPWRQKERFTSACSSGTSLVPILINQSMRNIDQTTFSMPILFIPNSIKSHQHPQHETRQKSILKYNFFIVQHQALKGST